MDWLEPAVFWYLTTTAVALAVTPVVLLAFRGVTDKGVTLARPLGLITLIWPVWLLASIGDGLVPFTGTALWATLAVLAVISWAVGLRRGIADRETLVHLGLTEIGHLGMFVAFLALRGFIPAVGGPNTVDQEKPMDLMMLASSMRASEMPPLDAWLSGHDLNYYYLGYAMWGGIGEMIGTTPAIAYNLAVVSTFAMTAMALIGTVANILSRFVNITAARTGGIIALVLVALIGNPWAAATILDDPGGQWERFPFEGVMWNATRIIPVDGGEAISEFPAFSFLFADLHPHLMAIPFAITALGIGWMFASLPVDTRTGGRVGRLALAGIAVTSLYAMNSWDFPTWFAVVALGIAISPGFSSAGQRLLGIAISLAAGIAAWLPFFVAFEPPVATADSAFADAVADLPVIGGVLASIGGYAGDRTTVQDYLSIFGFFYPVLVITILTALLADREGDPLVNRLGVITAVVLAAIGLLMPAPLLILVGLPMVAGGVVMLRATNVTLELVAVGLATLAFALTVIPEFFFLLDAFGTRMNTIFKLYLQVWLLSGIAAALGLVYLWERARALPATRALLAVATAAILIAGLSWPVVAASQWIPFKNPGADWVGVDGLTWLEESPAADPATREALAWLWDNAGNEDVLLAAGGCAYRAPVGFPAAASGVQSIIGWDNHERQWHLGTDWIDDEIVSRVADVNALLADPTGDLLDQYDVTLIYLGRAEASGVPGAEPSTTCAPGPFPAASSPEFPGEGWEEVFSEDGVRILARNQSR